MNLLIESVAQALEAVNQNQGLLSLILTGCLFIAYVTQVVILEKQVDIMDRQTKYDHQPLLEVDSWSVSGTEIRVTLSNIGNGPARDIQLGYALYPLKSISEYNLNMEPPSGIRWKYTTMLVDNTNNSAERGYRAEELLDRDGIKSNQLGVTFRIGFEVPTPTATEDKVLIEDFKELQEEFIDSEYDEFRFEVYYKYKDRNQELVEENLVWSHFVSIEDADGFDSLMNWNNISGHDIPVGTPPEHLRDRLLDL